MYIRCKVCGEERDARGMWKHLEAHAKEPERPGLDPAVRHGLELLREQLKAEIKEADEALA